MKRKIIFGAHSATLFFLIAFSASADVVVGEGSGEFWVNGPDEALIGTDPNYPDVAIDSQGRSIYVWKSFGGEPGVTDRNEVYLRRFLPNNEPLSDPVRVNTTLEDDQFFPRIALSADDTFLVIYQSDEPDPNAGVDRKWVRSQAFDADASPLESEQLVTTFSSGEATNINADVAALKGGGYVVVWRGRDSDGDGGTLNIWARLIGPNGVALGAPFVANSTEGVSERFPAVTELNDGGFLVIWQNPDIHGRRFMADGTPVGDDFQIDTFAGGPEADPDAVLHADGRLLIVWKDEALGADRFIRGRMYSETLTPLGNDFAINTNLENIQILPRVADYGRAGFIVVWEANISVGDDNSDRSIQGRIVTGHNQFDGPQFQVNEWITGSQQFPGVGGRNDRIGIAWHSKSNPDANFTVINGQLWSACGIFCDSFEGEQE